MARHHGGSDGRTCSDAVAGPQRRPVADRALPRSVPPVFAPAMAGRSTRRSTLDRSGPWRRRPHWAGGTRSRKSTPRPPMRLCATTAPTWIRRSTTCASCPPAGAITQDSWHTIEHAAVSARRQVDAIGTSADVFGVVHGDLNPDNIIVAGDGTVQLIDLAQLAVAPYLWDLGVALYQYSYQDASVRRALITGYRDARPGTDDPATRLGGVCVCRRAHQPRLPVHHPRAADLDVVPHQRRRSSRRDTAATSSMGCRSPSTSRSPLIGMRVRCLPPVGAVMQQRCPS